MERLYFQIKKEIWKNIQLDKCYDDKPETIDALKENIRKAIGDIKLHTIDNVKSP